MAKDTGGPAFPGPGNPHGRAQAEFCRTPYVPPQGINARDYFAAHCPITFSEYLNFDDGNEDSAMIGYAEMRWQYADAMIEIRGK